MPADLTNEFISDFYTSLLHVGRVKLDDELDYVYDGSGTQTQLAFKAIGEDVIANNVIQPKSPSLIEWIDLVYPVGSILLSADNNNPGDRFIGSVWEQVSEGRFIVGVGTGTDKNDKSRTYSYGSGDLGEYTHSLKISELPPHDHMPADDRFKYYVTWDSLGYIDRQEAGDDNNSSYCFRHKAKVQEATSQGDGVQFNVTPPEFGVYVWERKS